MRNNTLASQPQALPAPRHGGELETRKNIQPPSMRSSQPATPSPVLPSRHPCMHPSNLPFICFCPLQLFVYLSISSFYSSIYSTSCKEIQYRRSILQTPRCKSKPMVSKYLEISCEKSQIKPYFSRLCAQIYKKGHGMLSEHRTGTPSPV